MSVFCFYAALICGVIVALVMLPLRQPVLHLLGADADTFPYASQYFTFIILGAPFIIVSYTPSNLLRAEGFVTVSMTGTILGAVINMILDPIFISVLEFGAAGAAIATVMGNICSDIYFVYYLLNRNHRLSILPIGFFISYAEVRQIMAIGIPASITNLMQSFGMTLMNRFLITYGNEKAAAMGIVMKVNMIAVLILVGFAFGAQPLIGYNYGAKNTIRLRKILIFYYGFECCVALIFSILLYIGAPALISWFIEDMSIVSYGVSMLRMQQIGMIFVAIVFVTTYIFQSAGKAWGAYFCLSAGKV